MEIRSFGSNDVWLPVPYHRGLIFYTVFVVLQIGSCVEAKALLETESPLTKAEIAIFSSFPRLLKTNRNGPQFSLKSRINQEDKYRLKLLNDLQRSQNPENSRDYTVNLLN